MGATVRTHLVLDLLPCLVDLLAALGWHTTAAVALFALLACGPRPRPATTTERRPRASGTALCLATLVLLVLLAS